MVLTDGPGCPECDCLVCREGRSSTEPDCRCLCDGHFYGIGHNDPCVCESDE